VLASHKATIKHGLPCNDHARRRDKKNRKIHDMVEAGFLVGSMMKEENVREMKQRKKVKKEEKHAKNMKCIGALQFVR
jgi:hypothetical protein